MRSVQFSRASLWGALRHARRRPGRVARAQVIDTVELFFKPGQRKVSLRCLTAYLLQLDIQDDTHDSIEDARSALLVYNRYVELTQDPDPHALARAIDHVYETGHQLKWKTRSMDTAVHY